jgi:hypothetical protein
MPKFKIKSFIAFVILGSLIYAFRNAHGRLSEYLIVIPFIIIFWYLLDLKLAHSNLRNILFLSLIFVTLIIVFRVIFPVINPVATMGVMQEYDLNPAKIGIMKVSHDIALEIHFDHRPATQERYFKIGDLAYTDDGLHYTNKTQNLDLSKLPRTYEWAKNNLIADKLDYDVDKVKSWFVKSISYSLTPGELNSSMPLDQFLFDRRAGFCEHFAASLSTILRLKEFKSKVAVGYAGGSWNPILKILTFENADAHAWVEVFDQKLNQYKIVDPTSWVFPAVLAGRTMAADFAWIFLAGSVFFCLFGIFLVQKGSAVERLLLKVSRAEKKHGLESKGLTLSERINKLAAIERSSEERMFNSLGIYLKMYDLDKSDPKLDQTLKKSLAAW